MLRNVSALTVGHLQGTLKFLACAAYMSTCVVGILHMIEITAMNTKRYSFENQYL